MSDGLVSPLLGEDHAKSQPWWLEDVQPWSQVPRFAALFDLLEGRSIRPHKVQVHVAELRNGVMTTVEYETRRAEPSDADHIATAHRDSIRSLGPQFYPSNVVDDWAEGLTGDVYVKAMEGGEAFFIATGKIAGTVAVLGFATDYRIDSSQHGTSVYVRGVAARQGIGSALFRLAEARAIARGAASIRVEASLAAVEFYKANGFAEVARGETRLMSGRPIACVFMRKDLSTT